MKYPHRSVCSHRLLTALWLALAGTFHLEPALAASQTSTLHVEATVTAACKVKTRDLAFGNYAPLAQTGPLDAKQPHGVGVNCTKGTDFVVALNYGIHGGSATGRFMADGNGNKLRYNLYTDAGRNSVWYSVSDGCGALPNTSSHCGHGTGNGPGAVNTDWFVVYGRIPPQPSAKPGHYVDTITVTVTFN